MDVLLPLDCDLSLTACCSNVWVCACVYFISLTACCSNVWVCACVYYIPLTACCSNVWVSASVYVRMRKLTRTGLRG
jgi:hypothetical protein